MTETNRIEYKAQLTKDLDLEKEVVAFLNFHEGGLVYIGVNKTGKTVGVADPDGDCLKLKTVLKTTSPLLLWACLMLFQNVIIKLLTYD